MITHRFIWHLLPVRFARDIACRATVKASESVSRKKDPINRRERWELNTETPPAKSVKIRKPSRVFRLAIIPPNLPLRYLLSPGDSDEAARLI